MKHSVVILRDNNKTHVFDLPKTYNGLLQKVNRIFNNSDFDLFYKNKIISSNNFENINESNNIININFRLKGGRGFPNFINMIINSIVNIIVSLILGIFTLFFSFLMITYSLEQPENRKKGVIKTFETLKFFPPNWKDTNFFLEFLFFGITFYVFSLQTLSILYQKSQKCPTFEVNWQYLGILTGIPFPILLILCFFQKSTKNGQIIDPTIIYILTGITFFLCGYLITSQANKTLKEWEHENSVTDLFKMSFYAIGWYILLRTALIIGNNNFGILFGSLMMIILYLFVSIGILPEYIDAYLKYISSPFSKCPQQ